jgi:D-alanyl-D-alanine carboxypeptidase (penicillin-binding protein 5/6)
MFESALGATTPAGHQLEHLTHKEDTMTPQHGPRTTHRRSHTTDRGSNHKGNRRSSHRRRAAGPRRRRSPLFATSLGTLVVLLVGLPLFWKIRHHSETTPSLAHAAQTGAPSTVPIATRPVVKLAIADQLTIPGHPDIDWPTSGQAAIAVDGVGLVGTSGPVNQPQPIASVTKTMTAYLILKDHPLSPGQDGPLITITAAQAAALPEEESLHQSLIPIHTGEQLTERQALQALMLASADNIAQVLADWDSGGEDAFVAKMNATAKQLGMTHTTFAQPSGYSSGSVSTATDLVLLGEQAMANPFLAQLVDETSASVPGDTFSNYNALLGTDGVVGIKTGSTYWAGGCLLFAAHETVHGHTLTLVGAVLDQPGDISTMLNSAFTATAHLITSTTAALSRSTPLTTSQIIAHTTQAGKTQPLHLQTAPTITTWPGLSLNLTITGTDKPALTIHTPDGHTLTTPLVAGQP